MSLIKCPECGQQISDRAKICPHCGYQTSSHSEQKGIFSTRLPLIWFTCGVLLITAIGLIWYFIFSSNSKGTGPSQPVLSNEIVEITPDFSEKISKYLQIGEFSDGRAAVKTDEYKWGFIDTKGDLVIPAIYTNWPIGPKFSDGLAYVETEYSKCYITPDGTEAIKLANDDVASNFVDGKAVVYKAHQNGDGTFAVGENFRIINQKGETINEIPIPPGVSLIDDGMYGFTTITLKICSDGFLVPIEYASNLRLYDFQGNYLGEKEWYYESTPPEYEYVIFNEKRGFSENYTEVILKGIKDRQGNIIVPAREWNFANEIYDPETNSYRYITPQQGLFLVVLEEDPIYLNHIDDKRMEEESPNASYYGFVNLRGEDTFSDERWERQRIQTYNKLNGIQL